MVDSIFNLFEMFKPTVNVCANYEQLLSRPNKCASTLFGTYLPEVHYVFILVEVNFDIFLVVKSQSSIMVGYPVIFHSFKQNWTFFNQH